MKLCLRTSLPGHWTLIDPLSHKPLYYVNGREIRRGTFDGPLIATMSSESSSQCRLSFSDQNTVIDIKAPGKLSVRGRHRFAVNGRKMYWKRNIVCREASTRRVYADTDDELITIYELGEPLIDVIVLTFIAVQMKCKAARSGACSWFTYPPSKFILIAADNTAGEVN